MSGVLAAIERSPDSDRALDKGPAEVKAEPSWMEAASANWRLAQDDEEDYRFKHVLDAYKGVEDALVATGRPRARYNDPRWGGWLTTVETSTERRDRLWGDVEEARRANPAAFKDLPGTRPEFERWAKRRQGARDRDADVAARGPTGSMVVPSLGFGLTRMAEPQNLATIPLGGNAATVSGMILRQFGAGVVGQAIMTPQIALGRIEMGEGYSARELATDLTVGGATNAAFAGALAAIPRAGQALEQRIVSPEYRLARQLAREVPADVRPPELQAALHVAERAGEIDASSPYRWTHAELAAHGDRLAEVQARLEAMPEPARPRALPNAPAVPVARVPVSAAGSGAGGSYDPARLKGLIAGPESGGNPRAVNQMGSSASGTYQFVEGTFKAVYDKVYGGGGAAAWANRRFDPAVQEALMDRLMADNAAVLRKQSIPVTDGNMYVMHVLGSGNGPKLLRAADDVPVASLLSATIVRQNPSYFGKGRTVAEALGVIRSKVGDRANSGASGGGGELLASAPPAPIIRPDALDTVRPLVTAAGRELPIASFRPEEIGVDAALMQFKSGGDELGVTERLRGVQQWDPISAGMVTVWEANDGRRLIADGHQRLGLARRIRASNPDQEIQLNAFVLREADGFTARDARVLTALKNIREGSGAATDAGKVFRDVGLDEGLLASLPPRSMLIRDGKALARLSDEAFGAVINDVIPESHAAAIGHLAPDPATHMALVELLSELDPPNRSQAESVVRQALDAGFVAEKQEELFGTRDVATALFAQKARALDRTLAELRKLKGAFGVASRNAEALDAAGNRIDVDASTAARDANARALALVDALALRKGNAVNDLFNAAAARLGQGERIDRVVKDLVRDLGKLDLDAAARGSDGVGEPGGSIGGSGRDSLVDGEVSPEPDSLSPASRDELEAAGQAGFALFDEPSHSLFDDPSGPGVAQVADSVWHDLRAAKEITAKSSDAAGSGAESAAKVIGPLIDLDDGKGARSIADIDDELAAQEAGIAAIRGCL